MSVSIIVERSPADKTGEDIVDSLISSELQAIQRGTKEIDENSTNRFIVSGSSVLTAYMEPAKIVQVSDIQKGTYNAMLLSYSANISRQSNGDFSAMTSITLEKDIK